MRTLKQWLALAAVMLATACGGGGSDAGNPPFGGGGGGGGDTPIASDISLALSRTSVPNSGGETVTATVTAVDALRNALGGIPVTISVDNNAVASVSGPTTADNGTVTADISIGADRSNRLITVTAVSGGLQRTATFQVIGAQLTGTLVPSVVTPGSSDNKIQYRLTDVNSNAMAGQAITVTAPGVADVTGNTDSSGAFEYAYTAPSTVGNFDVTASSGGQTLVSTVLVQGSGSGAVPSAPENVQSASISANPSVININTATSSNRSEIRALFLGADNRPIPRVRVRFELPDPNNIGGSLSTTSNVVYTDANGIATSAYIPGSRSSPTNGVIVRACYSRDDFASPTACPAQVQTTLTVVSEALAVTIGTDNTIADGTSGLTYVKRYVVLVVDASGQAKADVQLTASIDLTRYIKGYYDGPGAWNRDAPSALFPAPIAGSVGFTGVTCANEDLNRNGVLETGEDVNTNGQLDPRKSDVAVSFVGSNRTTANGTAVLQIEYPKNVATWIDFEILVAASGVSGTEGRATWAGRLGAAAGAFTATPPPAFVVSPYGAGGIDSNSDGVVDCRDKD